MWIPVSHSDDQDMTPHILASLYLQFARLCSFHLNSVCVSETFITFLQTTRCATEGSDITTRNCVKVLVSKSICLSSFRVVYTVLV